MDDLNDEEDAMERVGPATARLYQGYQEVEWASLLASCQSRLEMAVHYYDSWIDAHFHDLVALFRRPEVRVRIFVSDPHEPNILRGVKRFYPEYDLNTVKDKVVGTGVRMHRALEKAGGGEQQLQLYYAPFVMSYSAHQVDDLLLIGLFEMFRRSEIESPMIAIDLRNFSEIRDFWAKELEGLLSSSREVKPGNA